MLLAESVDALRLLVWSKTKDASRNVNRPEPLPRPGVEPTTKKRGGTSTTDIDQARERYAVGRIKSDTSSS